MAAPVEVGKKLFRPERGSVANGLIQDLDSRLGRSPQYASVKVQNRTAVREYVEVDRGTFTVGAKTYKITSRNYLAWEIPLPWMSGFPIQRRAPIMRRRVVEIDKTDPKNPKVTKVKLRTKYKQEDFGSTGERNRKFKGGAVSIKDGKGRHINSEEAVKKTARVFDGIAPRSS